jgi:hypothetical protein
MLAIAASASAGNSGIPLPFSVLAYYVFVENPPAGDLYAA